MTGRPETNEYATYYENYVRLVPDGDIAETLARQIDDSLATCIAASPRSSRASATRPDKWTIKQVLGHVCDAERVFTYRAVAFARGDSNPLPSFDQDKWMPFADSDSRTWAQPARRAQDRSGGDRGAVSQPQRRGPGAPWRRQRQRVSVRALGFITAGHERHHLDRPEDEVPRRA